MTLDTRSSMKRSWVTSTRPPSNSARLSSRTSSVGMSRSFVGSSRIRRSAGSRIRRAMRMRACSPPDSRPTGSSSCSGRNRKRLAHEATWTLRPWKTTASPSGASARRSGSVGVQARRGAGRSGPAAGPRRARSRRRRARRCRRAASSSVVLPLPFGPMRPTWVPRMMARSRPRMSGRPPSAFDSPRATSSLRVRRAEAASSMPAVPPAAARPGVAELLDEAAGLPDAPLGLGRARLRAAPQPLDLAADRVGQRLLVGGLAAQEARRGGPGTRCTRHRPGTGRPGRRGSAPACGWPRARGSSGRGSRRGRRAPDRRGALQPEDALHVEVVGGLVHQKDVGRAPPARARSPGASSSRPTVPRPPRARPRSRRGRASGRCARGARPPPPWPGRRRARPRRCRRPEKTGSCGT